MKNLILVFTILASTTVFADQYVNGYMKNNGTYVQGHSRTSPNNTLLDNYSTQGNTNPYTGRSGNVNPWGR